ncbi:hypothetical protein BKA62DRAFT_766306 [Auriculariales sp. MPI-PUGE-AT-0066]|nr:hypothetical protein BKA62DRAFT_766306 [Auriculariales sp. MPI-PUGE-AT-0066]
MTSPLPKRGATLPPSYSPSDPTPDYTPDAGDEEVSLDRTIRITSQHSATNQTLVRTYTRRQFHFSVNFAHQEEACEMPTYQQGWFVAGHVFLHNLSGYQLLDIQLEIEGWIELELGNWGRDRHSFLKLSEQLWPSSEADSIPDSVSERLEFSVKLPRSLRDQDGSDVLLPSSSPRETLVGLSFAVMYSAKISISIRGYGGLVQKQRYLDTPFKYVRRSTPQAPSLPSDSSFMSTVKTAPEEWTNVLMEIPLQDTDEQVFCTLALPASRIFCMTDNIPVHLQLSGSEAGLRQFLPAANPLSPSDESAPSSSKIETIGSAKITVYLQRQVSAEVNGRRVQRKYRISAPADLELGSGSLSPLSLLAWNGTVIPKLPAWWAPCFRMAKMETADQVVIEATTSLRDEAKAARGVVKPYTQAFGVKLVTDRLVPAF